MKGFKFLASCMAVGAVSVACAAASFAVDTTYQLTVSDYNATNGTIDITVPTAYAELVNGDYTLLVLSDDATSITEANKGIVKQIQQGDNTILTGVKVGTITPTDKAQTFYVRVGGADATEANPTGFAAGTFTVKAAETPDEVLIGDVDASESITAQDAAEVAKNVAHLSSKVDENVKNYYAAAYASGDNVITAQDAAEIAKHVAHISTTYIDTKVEVGKYGLKPSTN